MTRIGSTLFIILLAALSLNTTFIDTTPNITFTDTTPPELINFEVTPIAINTSTGSATISVRIEARDNFTGFGAATGTGNGSIDIISPSGQPVGLGSLPITGGTDLEPIFEFELEFPQFSEQGTWEISLVLIDNLFNTSSFNSNDLALLGFPSTIEVTSLEDSTPPLLVNLEVTPLVIDTTTDSATISVRIEALEDLSGFQTGSIMIESPSGQPVGSGSLSKTGGTDLEPILEIELEFPQFSEPGIWDISLTLVDNVFNTLVLETTDLAKLGFPSTLEVASVEDSNPPELINLEVAPLVVNTMDDSSKICVRIEAQDDLSGFQTGSIMIESPSGQPVGSGSLSKTGGSDLEPILEIELEFPQFSEPGIWDISLTLVDNVFNTLVLTSEDLSRLGFPSTVEVTTNPVANPEPCFSSPKPSPTATPAPPTPTPPGATPMPTSTPTPSPAPTASPDPGDLNNDGVPDEDQENVETIEVEDGSLTIETDNETTIMNFASASSLINQSPFPPSDIEFLGILFSFEILNVGIGDSTEARIILENPVDFDVYYKFGSTPNNPAPHWYEFNFNGETGAERLPNGDILLHFVDGKRGDNDLTENGRIVDPGGPAVFRNQEPQDGNSSGGGCSLSDNSNSTQSVFNLLLVFLPVFFLLVVRIAKCRLLSNH